MRKTALFVLLFCFTAFFSFAQNETGKETREEAKKEMEALRLELKAVMENVQAELQNLDIGLSALDQLQDFDWETHLDNEEAIAYLNSEEFKEEMKGVQEEVNAAMQEAREEMAKVEAINWEEINQAIEKAMEEVERELSGLREEE